MATTEEQKLTALKDIAKTLDSILKELQSAQLKFDTLFRHFIPPEPRKPRSSQSLGRKSE